MQWGCFWKGLAVLLLNSCAVYCCFRRFSLIRMLCPFLPWPAERIAWILVAGCFCKAAPCNFAADCKMEIEQGLQSAVGSCKAVKPMQIIPAVGIVWYTAGTCAVMLLIANFVLASSFLPKYGASPQDKHFDASRVPRHVLEFARNSCEQPYLDEHFFVDDILYTQATICSIFEHGEYAGLPMESLVADLHRKPDLQRQTSSRLDVAVHKDRMYAFSNQLLWCFQKYQREVHRYTEVQAPVRVWSLRSGAHLPDGCDVALKFEKRTGNGSDVEIHEQKIPNSHGASSAQGALPVVIPLAIDGYSRSNDPLGSWLHDGQHVAVACKKEAKTSTNLTTQTWHFAEWQKHAARLDSQQRQHKGGLLLLGPKENGELVIRAPVSSSDLEAMFGLMHTGSPDLLLGDAKVYIDCGVCIGHLREVIYEKVGGVQIEQCGGTAGFLNRVTSKVGGSYAVLSGSGRKVAIALHVISGVGWDAHNAATMIISQPKGPLLLAALQHPVELLLDFDSNRRISRLVIMARTVTGLVTALIGLAKPDQLSQLTRDDAKCLKVSLAMSSDFPALGTNSARSGEACRDYLRGNCSFGARCRYVHADRSVPDYPFDDDFADDVFADDYDNRYGRRRYNRRIG